MGFLEQLRDRARSIDWRASVLGVITVAELLLLLAVLIPVMGAGQGVGKVFLDGG
jgi:hypothetical protein